jgi:hypothetical protein
MCQCAKNLNDTLSFDLDYVEHFSGVPKNEINQIIQTLHEHGLIRNELVTDTYENRPNRTEHTEQNIHTYIHSTEDGSNAPLPLEVEKATFKIEPQDIDTKKKNNNNEKAQGFLQTYKKYFPKCKVKELAIDRLNKIKKFQEELKMTIENFDEACLKASKSDFLSNKCKAFDFDWMFQKGKNDQLYNINKILEGNYDNKTTNTPEVDEFRKKLAEESKRKSDHFDIKEWS